MEKQQTFLIGGITLVVIIIISSFFAFVFLTPPQSNELVVYRYEGFMGYGDIINNINYNKTVIDNEVFYGWAKKNGYTMKIIETDDANSLLQRLKLEKDNPVADVVIGLDNALLALAKAQGYAQDILEPYKPANASLLRPDLVAQLDSNYLLTPIDFGALAFYYDQNRVNETVIPNLNNLTIEDLKNPSIAKQLLLEDPRTSSPGTGFLLWSIAAYKYMGIQNNWTQFWSAIKDTAKVFSSWSEAFSALYSDTVNRSILLSYATSPAYDRCIFNYDGTQAFFTHENNKTNSWLQIEGIGLVKNAPHPEAGKKFIDWMVSQTVQEKIPVTNWMYPANSEAELPSCFSAGAISPDKLNILNNILTINEVQSGLSDWLTQWESVMTGTSMNLSFFHKQNNDMLNINIQTIVIDRKYLN